MNFIRKINVLNKFGFSTNLNHKMNLNTEYLYFESFFSLWFFIFDKAEFQDVENTRILRLRQKLTGEWSL